jgi:hypothetical protein
VSRRTSGKCFLVLGTYFAKFKTKQMAEPNIGAAFDNMAIQMTGLSTVIGAQGVAQIITPFAGDPKNFKAWIKSIENYAILTNTRGERIKTIVFKSSKGSVSDFIQIYISDQPERT